VADLKIAQLPSVGTMVDTDTIPVVRAGATSRVTTGTALADITSLKASRTTDEANIATLQTQTVGVPARTALDQSGYTWFNQGTASVAQGSGLVYLHGPSQSALNVRGRITTTPATPYTITALCICGLGTTNNTFVGLCWQENSTGKLVLHGPVTATFGSVNLMQHQNYTNPNTFSSVVASENHLISDQFVVYLRINDDGVNLTTFYSFDGVNFRQLGQQGRTVFMAGGPDHVGFFVACTGSAGEQTLSIPSRVQS